ncbi:MAG: hypothetical protein KDK30_18730, partial [Leptospiraceae bacterium]|nr:hypothetical protein [Leptospiraceae bacterium]
SLHVQGLDVFLTDIDVDPADLANHNSADLEINADVQLSDRAGNEKGMFLVRSTGTIVPFDPNQAGEFNTDVEYALTLLKGSRVSSFMVVNELMNALPEILKLAVDRDKLKGQAELTHDVDVVVKYNRGLLTFLNEPTFQTKRYDIGLRKGSWIRLTNSTHKFTGKLIATQEDSDKTIAKIDQELERVVKDKAKAQEIRNKQLGMIIENNRVYLAFVSTGNLADPNTKLLANVPDITDLVKGSVGDVIEGRINSELDKLGPGAREAADQLQNLFN